VSNYFKTGRKGAVREGNRGTEVGGGEQESRCVAERKRKDQLRRTWSRAAAEGGNDGNAFVLSRAVASGGPVVPGSPI